MKPKIDIPIVIELPKLKPQKLAELKQWLLGKKPNTILGDSITKIEGNKLIINPLMTNRFKTDFKYFLSKMIENEIKSTKHPEMVKKAQDVRNQYKYLPVKSLSEEIKSLLQNIK